MQWLIRGLATAVIGGWLCWVSYSIADIPKEYVSKTDNREDHKEIKESINKIDGKIDKILERIHDASKDRESLKGVGEEEGI